VAESVQAPGRVGRELVRVGKEDAARAHGGVDEPPTHDARTDRRSGVVAPARGHGDVREKAELFGHALAEGARVLGALVDSWHPVVWDLQSVQDLAGPIARPHVQQQGARGVRGVGSVLAGEPQPYVVLGKQDAGDLFVVFGLFVSKPDDLWCLEAGERGVARDRDQSFFADGPCDPVALRLRALIVPQQRGPYHPVGAVEEDGAVHLARERDTSHLAPRFGGDLCQDYFRALPPVFRLLLGPARAWGVKRVVGRGFGHDLPRVVYGDGPGAAGPHVEADKNAHASFLLARASLRRLRTSSS
jgi:hypothetical protein